MLLDSHNHVRRKYSQGGKRALLILSQKAYMLYEFDLNFQSTVDTLCIISFILKIQHFTQIYLRISADTLRKSGIIYFSNNNCLFLYRKNIELCVGRK